MLYIHSTIMDESEDQAPKLLYTCRNCDYTEMDRNSNRCIYENVYSQAKSTYDIIYNKYTRYDATLPRVSTIKCIKEGCVSNMGLTHALILSDLSILTNVEIVNTQLDAASFKLQFETTLKTILEMNNLDETRVHKLDNDDTMVIHTNSKDQAMAIKSELEQLHRYIEYFERLESNTIFIKYDQEDLKFVYICDYCNTSWKNK
jgi:hypothetical protein